MYIDFICHVKMGTEVTFRWDSSTAVVAGVHDVIGVMYIHNMSEAPIPGEVP